MSEKSFTEILEIANALERDFKTLVEDAENRYELYSLRRAPELSEDIAREGQVNILSPLVIHAAHTIRADLMMNPTEFTVIPLARETGGAIPKVDVKKADSLEKALAVLWGKLNDGRRVDRDVIWHQLISPFGVMILEFNALDLPDQPNGMTDKAYTTLVDKTMRTWIPWSITTPDPLTCRWTERGNKPTVFVRRYKQLVGEVEQSYSKRRGTKDPEKNLRWAGNHWNWVSDDYNPNEFRHVSGFEEVEMIWLDDGANIYHVALNHPSFTEGKGQVVWSGPNPINRVSAFIVPGGLTPLRKPEDRYEPFLWPLMQAVDQINVVRTTRATASRNAAGPDNYIALDPEIVKLYEGANKKLPASHRWKKNETPYLLGQVMDRPVRVDPDLDKLEMRLQEDLQRFLPSPFVHILDPAVIKAATATSILHAAESGLRVYGPLMSAYDATIRDLMEGIIYSAENFYDSPVSLFASGEELSRGVNLKEGALYQLGKDDLDFSHMVHVKTRSMTQAQAAAQYDLALKQWILPDGSKGPATFDDIIDAGNYADKEAQKEKLARERILSAIDPYIQQFALAEAIVEIEYETGIKLPLGGEQPGQQQAPSRMPNSAQRMDSPLVVGPAGGSDGTTVGQ